MAAKSNAKLSEKQGFISRIFGEHNSITTSKSDYHSVSQRRPWSPGLQRSPWMALLAIFLTMAAIATCIGILVASDGRPVNSWRFQPTVYLAIATTIANICLHFAFAEGVNIVWWRRALGATTVGELHRAYSYGNNFWAALFAYRYFNFIALACVMVTVSPINGPLMQRASQISTGGISSVARTLQLPIATEIPARFTAYLSTRTQYVSMLHKDFIPIVSEWNVQSQISFDNACSGTCTGIIRGAGFNVNCSRSTLSFDLKPFVGVQEDFTQNITGSQYFGITVDQALPFGSPPNSGTISVVIKNTTACHGELQIQNCTLRPATVNYPVAINGNQRSISLQPSTTIWDDEVGSVYPDLNTVEARYQYGGFYKALKDRYTSGASMSTEPVYSAFFQSEGFYVNAYAVTPDDSTLSPVQDCQLSYADPLPDLLQSARDLMFRTAIASAPLYANATAPQLFRVNGTTLSANTQTIAVTQSGSEATYKSEYAWLAGAILATMLPTLAVLGMFWGYWKIGRRVTLSPVETAKALGSPLLVSEDGNSTARELVREIGRRKVRYGGVARDEQGGAHGSRGESDGFRERQGPRGGDRQVLENGVKTRREEDGTMLKLQMRSPDSVLAPSKGWVFAG